MNTNASSKYKFILYKQIHLQHQISYKSQSNKIESRGN